MKRQGKDRSVKPRKAPARRAPEEPSPNPSTTGAPLIVAIILIAAIALGLGFSMFRRSHEPNGIAMPATTPMPQAASSDTALSPPAAESAAPQKSGSYGATLTN